MSDKFLKVKDNGASGLALVRAEVEDVAEELGIPGLKEQIVSTTAAGAERIIGTADSHADLNDVKYRTPGNYRVSLTRDLQYIDNGPTTRVPYRLLVIKTSGNDRLYQIALINYVTGNYVDRGIAYRYYNNIGGDNWSSWKYVADVAYVDSAVSTIQQNKIGHYLTVSAMQSDASLVAGMTAETLGYFAANDGGGAVYNIASSREHSYDVALNNGLFAVLVVNGDVDGAQLGCIDDNATYTRLNNALQCAVDYNADLVFSRDIYTTTTIVIGSDFNKKHIRFKRIYYQYDATPETPVGSAVLFENCRDITVDCDAIIAGNTRDDTVSMHAFRYKQTIASNGKYIFNVNINCNYAWSSGTVVIMEPTAGGILECKINIGEASAKNSVFMLYPHGTVEPTPPKEVQACYIGQCYFSANHVVSRSDADYAVHLSMDTEHIAALNTTIQNLITGVAFDVTSFEGSNNGLYMSGDVKMITFKGLRVFEENGAAGTLIRSRGWVRHIYIKGLTPIRYDKTNLSTEYNPASANFVLDGGILSNSGFDFAESLLVSNKGVTFKPHGPLFWNRTTDFQFIPKGSTNARLITHFRNATADSDPLNAKNLNLTDLSYFDPYGVDTIYLTQNRTAGAAFTLYDGDNVVFDGSTMTEEGEHTYAVTVQYDNTNINEFNKTYLIRLVK